MFFYTIAAFQCHFCKKPRCCRIPPEFSQRNHLPSDSQPSGDAPGLSDLPAQLSSVQPSPRGGGTSVGGIAISWPLPAWPQPWSLHAKIWVGGIKPEEAGSGIHLRGLWGRECSNNPKSCLEALLGVPPIPNSSGSAKRDKGTRKRLLGTHRGRRRLWGVTGHRGHQGPHAGCHLSAKGRSQST